MEVSASTPGPKLLRPGVTEVCVIFELDRYLPWVSMGAGALCLLVTLIWIWRQPGRLGRLATLSGVLVHFELVAARAIVYNPEQWSPADNPWLLRTGNQLLGTWLLILVGMGWRYMRQGLKRPLLTGVGMAIPGIALAVGMRLADAYLRGAYPEVRMGLPYDIAVMVVAFIGPIVTFEFLCQSDLWGNREGMQP